MSWQDLKVQLEELEGKTLAITKSSTSFEELQNLIASHFITEETLPQIQPMLAFNTEDLSSAEMEKFNTSEYSVEPKFNGIRMLCFFLGGKVRFQTRGRSRKTQLFTERTGHYPQYQKSFHPELEGTILDGEMLGFLSSPERKLNLWEDNHLSLVMSFNGGSDLAGIKSQKEKGWARFVPFDILKFGFQNISSLSQKDRRVFLLKATELFGLDVSPEWILGEEFNINERFNFVTKSGGEGLILKKRNAPYENCRSYSWLKIKRFEEAIGYISSIFNMGSGANAGMAGSVVVVDEKGSQIGICGGLSREMRKDLILSDGIINPTFVGRKVLIRWHIKDIITGNSHHARIVDWLDQNEDYEVSAKEEVSNLENK